MFLRSHINVFFFIVIITGARCFRIPQLDGRIVGGIATTIEEYPYQVSVQYSGSHICGGSIISYDVIITAAHCTFGSSLVDLSVRVGSSIIEEGGTVIPVREVFQNPLFNPISMDYDVSLLRLVKNIDFGPQALPIPLVSNNFKLSLGTKFVVTGWGMLSEDDSIIPNQLHMVEISYVDNERCQEAYYDAVVSERMICAGSPSGGKDSCQGDSGGPLVVNGALVGIVSWGYGCARPEFPGVYSRISQLRDYITNATNI